MPGPKTENLAVLFTDIKGFTDKTSRKTRSDILAMLEKHKELVLPILEEEGGRLVKTIGDAFLVVFKSPTDAVLSGMKVQDKLREYNQDKEGDDRIDVRIAINVGEVTLIENDIFGDPVNIASRIEGIAEAGEVTFTEAVYLAMNKQEVPSCEIGLFQLKGIPQKIRVYKVVLEEPVEDLPLEGQVQAPRGFLGRLRTKTRPPVPGASAKGAPVKGGNAKLPRRALAALIDVAICMILISSLGLKDDTHINVTKKSDKPGFGAKLNEAGRKLIDSEIEKHRAVLDSLPDVRVTLKGEFDIDDAFARLGKAGKLEVKLHPEVTGRIPVDLHAVPLRRAFDLLSHKNELTLYPGEQGGVLVRKNVSRRAEDAFADGIKIDKDGVRIGKEVSIDGDGVRVGDGIKIDKDGIRVGDTVISEKTAHVPGAVKMEGTETAGPWTEEKGADGKVRRRRELRKVRSVRVGAGDGSGDGEETLYKADGLEVKKITKKKNKAFPVLWVLYSTFFLAFWSATPGKKIMRLKVVPASGGAALDWKLALARSLLTLISAAPCFLGFFWAFFDKDRKTWHDLIAGTQVVSEEAGT